MSDEILARTEQIRLVMLNRIKVARDPAEIETIIKDASIMCWSYNLY